MPIFPDIRRIAGMHPPIDQGLCRRFGFVPVTLHDGVTLDQEFALHARRLLPTRGWIDYLEFVVVHRITRGIHALLARMRGIVARHIRPDFAHAEPGDGGTEHLLDLQGDRNRALLARRQRAHAHTQRARLTRLRGEQIGPMGFETMQKGRFFALGEIERAFRVKHVQQNLLGAGQRTNHRNFAVGIDVK